MASKLLNGFDFPYSFKENGECEKYDSKKGCTIYEDRPIECRIDSMSEIYEKELGMSAPEYYAMTIVNCNKMMNDLNIDKSFRIK
jgi:Fe-S-cluster containining protein